MHLRSLSVEHEAQDARSMAEGDFDSILELVTVVCLLLLFTAAAGTAAGGCLALRLRSLLVEHEVQHVRSMAEGDLGSIVETVTIVCLLLLFTAAVGAGAGRCLALRLRSLPVEHETQHARSMAEGDFGSAPPTAPTPSCCRRARTSSLLHLHLGAQTVVGDVKLLSHAARETPVLLLQCTASNPRGWMPRTATVTSGCKSSKQPAAASASRGCPSRC